MGIGETDTNPWVARECIRARGTHCMGLGLEEMLLGADPMRARGGLGDALPRLEDDGPPRRLDLRPGGDRHGPLGHQGPGLGVPALRTARRRPTEAGHARTPRSCRPGGRSTSYRDSLVEKAIRAKALGFRAAKLEVCINGPYSHNGLQESDDAVVEIVAECRRAVGPETRPDGRRRLRLARRRGRPWASSSGWRPYDLFFVETPIDIDDLDGHAFLHEHSPIPIAAGEWQNTHFEFLDLADRGKIDVLQPDVGRVGGFTEALKVCRIAAERGRLDRAALLEERHRYRRQRHLAAASDCCPYIEFLPIELAESPLRRELLIEDLRIVDGQLELPKRPGSASSWTARPSRSIARKTSGVPTDDRVVMAPGRHLEGEETSWREVPAIVPGDFFEIARTSSRGHASVRVQDDGRAVRSAPSRLDLRHPCTEVVHVRREFASHPGLSRSEAIRRSVGEPAAALSLADVTPGHGHPSRGVSGPVSRRHRAFFVDGMGR